MTNMLASQAHVGKKPGVNIHELVNVHCLCRSVKIREDSRQKSLVNCESRNNRGLCETVRDVAKKKKRWSGDGVGGKEEEFNLSR